MADKPLILVTGSNGQLGSELKALATADTAHRFLFLTRAELPLTNTAALQQTVEQHRPAFVINCAAYTAVDKAETERDEAFAVNATAVGVLAGACAQIGARFLHISTDYVFDGTATEPLPEDAPTNPLNVYGQSKLAGEEAALQANPDSVIIRTSWVYSAYGKNFVKTMLRLMAEKESISVVADQWGSPTYAADLAAALLHMVNSTAWHPGVYHYSNEGAITWFDFATEIARQTNSACHVLPTTTAAYPTPARRPLYSVMQKQKIVERWGVHLRPWTDSLAVCLRKLA